MSFQRNAFQNSAFQTTDQSKVAGQTVLTRGHAHNFSRKRFRELIEAWAAQEALAAQALQETGKRREVKQRAAAEAAEALRVLEEANEASEAAQVRADLVRMTLAMEAATGATKVRDVLAKARAIHDEVAAILEFEEDEEEVLSLLLH